MTKSKRRYIPPNDLDVIIPVYGRAALLQKCLDNLRIAGDGLNIKTVLVDDAGPEQEALGKLYGLLNGTGRVIRNRQNLGFPKSVNIGLGAGNAPLVLVLNTDIELEPDCIKAMMAEFDDLRVGIVGPKLLFPRNSTDPHRPAGKIQHAGIAVNFAGQVIHANIGWSADHPKVNERREVQAVTGACLMARRATLNQVLANYRKGGDPTPGPFNEVYSPGTYEDIELCFAARAAGWQVVYSPKAVAFHYVGASALGGGKGFPIARNELIFRARCGNMLMWDEWRWL